MRLINSELNKCKTFQDFENVLKKINKADVSGGRNYSRLAQDDHILYRDLANKFVELCKNKTLKIDKGNELLSQIKAKKHGKEPSSIREKIGAVFNKNFDKAMDNAVAQGRKRQEESDRLLEKAKSTVMQFKDECNNIFHLLIDEEKVLTDKEKEAAYALFLLAGGDDAEKRVSIDEQELEHVCSPKKFDYGLDSKNEFPYFAARVSKQVAAVRHERVKLLEKSAKLGNVEAQYELASIYYAHREYNQSQKNIEKALSLFSQVISQIKDLPQDIQDKAKEKVIYVFSREIDKYLEIDKNTVKPEVRAQARQKAGELYQRGVALFKGGIFDTKLSEHLKGFRR